MIEYPIFSDALLSEKTFDNTGEKQIINFMDLPVVFSKFISIVYGVRVYGYGIKGMGVFLAPVF